MENLEAPARTFYNTFRKQLSLS